MKRVARSSLLFTIILIFGVALGIISASATYDQSFADAHQGN